MAPGAALAALAAIRGAFRVLISRNAPLQSANGFPIWGGPSPFTVHLNPARPLGDE